MKNNPAGIPSTYIPEVSRQLRQVGFTVGPMEDGLLPIEQGEDLICWVNRKSTVFSPSEQTTPELTRAKERASNIAWDTAEYVNLLEQAPPLAAEGLSSPYKVLAEFNNVVLAGEPASFGAQFATWQWVRSRTSLWQGHYHNSYEGAKRDFVTRAGLLPESTLFTPDQLTEIYLCVDLELDGSTRIRDERQEVLHGLLRQLKELVPDIAERAEKSFQKDPDMEDSPRQEQSFEM